MVTREPGGDGAGAAVPAAQARLLYIVSEDWYFLSHRLPMARAAHAAGYEVHVATRVTDGAAAIAREGFHLHPVPFVRGRVSLWAAVATIRALRRVQREVAPAIVHRIAIEPIVLGALAAIGLPGAAVNSVTGLGYAFTSQAPKARLLRRLIGAALRLFLNRAGSIAIVQNPDDRALLAALGVRGDRIALVPGSGVEVDALQPLPEPSGPPTIAFVGRLIADKGIRTLVAAHRLLRERGVAVETLIAGDPDPANPGSISAEEIAAWRREPGLTLFGHVADIAAVWARAHIAVLPSRREGLPKSLLEAAACGRPLVATDVPGCREVVRPDETGLLVQPEDPVALADAVATLVQSAELRARLGAAARRLAVERFSADAIGRATVEVYRRLAVTAGRARVNGSA